MDRHRLPTWLPPAVVGAGLLAVPLLFLIPRSSETTDNILEAVPFFIVTMGVVLAIFARPGTWRTAGVVVGVIVVLAPIWYPSAYVTAVRLLRDDPSIGITIDIGPTDDFAYVVYLPAPVDGEARPALITQAIVDRYAALQLNNINGSWFITVESQGPFHAKHTIERPTGGEYWPTADWAPDAAPRPHGSNTTVTFTMRLIGQGWYCDGQAELAGTIAAETVRIHSDTGWSVGCT